jgi:hypothetical protein
MLVDDGLTFREIVMNEPLPKGAIQQAIIEFLKDRNDAAVFGAMAVNAYVDERRMTEDIDIASPNAQQLAEALRQYLNDRFQIAVRVRTVRDGVGFRLYQLSKPENRHLADVRPVAALPSIQSVDGVPVVTPPELIVGKVISCIRRKGKPKSFTDRRDLAHLLLKFPELKTPHGVVEQRLKAESAGDEVLSFWHQLAAEEILPEKDDDEFV